LIAASLSDSRILKHHFLLVYALRAVHQVRPQGRRDAGFDCGTTGKFRPVVLWGGRQRPKGGEGRVEQHLDRFFGVYLEGFLDAVVEDFATP